MCILYNMLHLLYCHQYPRQKHNFHMQYSFLYDLKIEHRLLLLDEFIPDVNMIEIISDHIATSKSLKNATKDEIKSLGVEGHQALHATLGTMTELKTVARMLTRGQLRVNMELVGSEEPFQLLSDMVNRLTMALIVVGLFVGSSIVYYAGMKPIIFGIPVIGFMGYVVAFALGVWIVIDIYLKGRKTKKR